MKNSGEILKSIVKHYKLKNPKHRIKKVPRWLYPIALEKKYQKIIQSILQRLIDITNNKVKKVVIGWREKGIIDSELEEDDLEDLDDIEDDYDNEINNIFNLNNEKLRYALLGLALSVGAFNLDQWNKLFKVSVGFDYPVKDIIDNTLLKSWIFENVKLISNLADDYKKKITNTIFQGYKKNESYSSLIRNINKLNYGFSANRTRLISRDQTSKLNGDYTKARQVDAGFDIYIWRNMNDERVVGNPEGKYPEPTDEHGNHWIMEGKYCSWSDPDVYAETLEDAIAGNWIARTSDMPEGDPGDEINCRCFGESVPEQILSEEGEDKSA